MAEANRPSGEIYKNPREAALLFLLPGIIQGLAVWGLIEQADQDAPPPLVVALLFFALVAPAAHFLTTTIGMRLKAGLFAGILGLAIAVLYFLAEASFGNPGESTEAVLAVSFFANLLICYIAVPFFRTVFERQQPANHYPSLFEFAWNLPVIGAAAGLFTLAFWAVLGIWAALFNLIGIDLFEDIFFDAHFAFPATFGAMGAAIGIVREREGIVLALRNVLFALLKVLSPILASATVLFAVSALLSGLDQLWEGWSAATLMVSAIAMAVILSNAVIGDEGRPDSTILRWSVRLQAFVLPLLAIFALYAMYLRLSEYGLTVARIYALIIVLFASAYAIVWSVSALRREGYGFLRQANIVLAGILFSVAVLVQTPILNTWAISAADQVARLKDGRISAEEFDYAYFQFDLGSAGKRALQQLKEDENLPNREIILAEINRVENAQSRYAFRRESVRDRDRLTSLIERGRLELVPANHKLTADLVSFLEEERLISNTCGAETRAGRCLLLRTQAFELDTDQYVLFSTWGRETDTINTQLLYQEENVWRTLYGAQLPVPSADQDALFESLRSGEATPGTVTYRTLDIGNQQVIFLDGPNTARAQMRVSGSTDEAE
ncbi:DUF4153 domain-containing protein [Parvularcula sp. IMCC14364]|uniref:DUF4153 domain-containing protein n=1 Tax=Parvularcula sp. IMCC14364 TaxID=3067902 RepID=UPI002741EB7F|nr:DUF4153 domain-containing protein [Parvularcula sp. IMCC14364]